MGEHRTRAAWWWAAVALAWAALIGYLSSRPPAVILSEHPGLDKPAHFFVFGVLGILVVFAVSRTGLRLRRQAMVLAALLVAMAGLADEAFQLTVPLRTFSLWDWLADAVGGGLGAGAAVVYMAVSRRTGGAPQKRGAFQPEVAHRPEGPR
jgi:VanZ family protein